jgi:hypothetical protein
MENMPERLPADRAADLVASARAVLGSGIMRAHTSTVIVSDEITTFAEVNRPGNDGPLAPVPSPGQLFFGRDDRGAPLGELIFWLDEQRFVVEIELVWYTEMPPPTWPTGDMLWR